MQNKGWSKRQKAFFMGSISLMLLANIVMMLVHLNAPGEKMTPVLVLLGVSTAAAVFAMIFAVKQVASDSDSRDSA